MDELASLETLPTLLLALTESRKSNTRMVLGLQGRSQIEVRYGREAESMLSQPRTKIRLRTSEPRAVEWIGKCIGEVEMEHLREEAKKPYITAIRKAWAQTLRRAGVPYFPIYHLRHTFATRLSAGGVADHFVTQMLRQGDSKVFKRYSQAKLNMMRVALGRLDRQANEHSVTFSTAKPN